MLSLAGREADIVGVNATLSAGEVGVEAAATATPSAFDETVGWIRAAAGERDGEIELQCNCAFVSVVPNRHELAQAMAPAFGLTADEALDVPLVLLGTVEQLCETLVQRREWYGLSYWVVPDEAMVAFAPVVERLSGT